MRAVFALTLACALALAGCDEQKPSDGGCEAETEAELCAREGKACGKAVATDRCGASRELECGGCPDGQVCGGGGLENACGYVCGDGRTDPGETCDGDCPLTCDDGKVCTADARTGDPSRCDVVCSHEAQTACRGGDGCCPDGCNANTDSDCDPECGNQVQEAGELCDGSSCPKTCSDGKACTADTLTGSASTCDAACSFPPIAECQGGDACCPPGCNANTDSDCSPVCGNGVKEGTEACDGADCPTGCDDAKACTTDTFEGDADQCTARCEHVVITAAKPGDGCCPLGATLATDSDCTPLVADGAAATVCAGDYQPPTIAASPDGFAVGCTPDGSQNVTPLVKFLGPAFAERAVAQLLTTDGYYYSDIQLTYLRGRYQTLYEYNCDDDGSWRVGWGWGCIDFREYDTAGKSVTPSRVFGEAGHNGHPVLDWSGSEFGVAWVSYDDMYFRRIASSGQLAGTGPGDNLMLGHDPRSSDARDDARTKIAWDGNGWGVFSNIDYHLYFARVAVDGSLSVGIKDTGLMGFSQTFSGQFAVLAAGNSFFVVYPSYFDSKTTRLAKFSRFGTLESEIVIQAGVENRNPAMFAADGLFYVLTNTAEDDVLVTAVDQNLTILPSKTGKVAVGEPMVLPAVSYDPQTGVVAVAYLDKRWSGNVKIRKFRLPK